MTGYMLRIEVPEGKIQEILQRIDKAQEEISKCYHELTDIGVLTVVPEGKKQDLPSGTD